MAPFGARPPLMEAPNLDGGGLVRSKDCMSQAQISKILHAFIGGDQGYERVVGELATLCRQAPDARDEIKVVLSHLSATGRLPADIRAAIELALERAANHPRKLGEDVTQPMRGLPHRAHWQSTVSSEMAETERTAAVQRLLASAMRKLREQ